MKRTQIRLPEVPRPLEEELARVVTCPHCGLEHAVFGLATWCADCGHDIFLTHVAAELDVLRRMLADVERRERELGARVAAKDIENALEDLVSIFEAVLKALLMRHLREQGRDGEFIQRALKDVANGFQSISRSVGLVPQFFDLPLGEASHSEILEKLGTTFEKRHPITHNLGVVDRKYLDKVRSTEQEGREVRVTRAEVEEAVGQMLTVLTMFHARCFPAVELPTPPANETAGDVQSKADGAADEPTKQAGSE